MTQQEMDIINRVGSRRPTKSFLLSRKKSLNQGRSCHLVDLLLSKNPFFEVFTVTLSFRARKSKGTIGRGVAISNAKAGLGI